MESANVLESPGEKKNENVPALLVDPPKTIQKNGEKNVFSRRKCWPVEPSSNKLGGSFFTYHCSATAVPRHQCALICGSRDSQS
jgi:hypothetical protein